MRASFNVSLAHRAQPAMRAASAYKDQEARHLAGCQVGTSIATRASMSVVEGIFAAGAAATVGFALQVNGCDRSIA
jgi:CBS domain containing-hemolysin-like protein